MVPDRYVVIANEMDRLDRSALIFRTIGWILLCWSAVTCTWIWMGEKSGSQLWLAWTGLQTLVGLLLLGIGSHRHQLSAEMATQPETTNALVIERREDQQPRAA